LWQALLLALLALLALSVLLLRAKLLAKLSAFLPLPLRAALARGR
jgi:hypothetical protein